MAELLKMKEKELELKERELKIMMAEAQIKMAAGAPVAKPEATAMNFPVARRAFPATAPVAALEEDLMDEPEAEEMCEVVVDKLGTVTVTLEGTPIVIITAPGEVTLSTGGWWTQDTLDAMNRVLKHIHVTVTAQGDPEDGNWAVSYRGGMQRFRDNFKLAAIGPLADRRATMVLASFQNVLRQAAHEPAAVAAARRLNKQGRF